MATHSPYIVNYINLLLRREQKPVADMSDVRIKPSDVDIYQIVDGQAISLKIETDENVLIDARLMSDPISEIYREYNSL